MNEKHKKTIHLSECIDEAGEQTNQNIKIGSLVMVKVGDGRYDLGTIKEFGVSGYHLVILRDDVTETPIRVHKTRLSAAPQD